MKKTGAKNWKKSSGLKKKQKNREAGYRKGIPDDLVTEILLRLPAKSLSRFCCLSKFCRALIGSPDFIRRHADQSVPSSSVAGHNSSHWLRKITVGWLSAPCVLIHLSSTHLYRPGNAYGPRDSYGYKLDLALNKGYVQARVLAIPYLKQVRDLSLSSVVGCCRGIVCLCWIVNNSKDHQQIRHFVLWNPFAGKFRTFIMVDHQNHHQNQIRTRYLIYYYYYFGYDGVNDDFKLLRTMKGSEYEFEIYSVRNNSWKHTRGGIPGSLGLVLTSDVFVEGTSAIHFLAFERSGDDLQHAITKSKSIVAFNFSTEIFTVVPLPDQCNLPKAEPIVDLVSLRGDLSFCQGDASVISVWVMKEYGVKESWVLLAYLDHNKIPVAYLDDGGKLLIASNECSKGNDEILQCYNTGTKEVENIHLSGLPRSWNFEDGGRGRNIARFYVYVPSLVDPNN